MYLGFSTFSARSLFAGLLHLRLLHVVTITMMYLAFVPQLDLLHDLGRRFRNTVESSTKSRRALVIDHGPPFSFALPRHSGRHSKVTISSAVAVRELRKVVFVVHDSLNGTQMRGMSLPAGWACEFQRKNGETETTVLKMRAAADVYYVTTSVWECQWPLSDDLDRRSVRIVGPERDVQGDGVFPLDEVRVPEAGLAACVKPLKNLGQDGETERRLEEYMRYYSSLGVDHFVLYINRDVEDSRALERLENVTVVRMAPELHDRVYGDSIRKNKVQVFFVNDCLWRTRYRAPWTMMQFDLDEYVIGTDSVKRELDALPGNVSNVYIAHSLVKPPYSSPLLRAGIEYTNKSFPTWGKSIVRPEMVDSQWVHSPTSFIGARHGAKTMRLLHFREDHYENYDKFTKNATWSTFDSDRRFGR